MELRRRHTYTWACLWRVVAKNPLQPSLIGEEKTVVVGGDVRLTSEALKTSRLLMA